MKTFLDRRHFLHAGLASSMAFGAVIPGSSHALSLSQPRLISIILRGALDGLNAAPPLGDPDYAGLRGDLAIPATGDMAALRLNDMFGLHPALKNFARLYGSGQAAVVHASATAYRQRSHFDGQDVMESGFNAPGHTDSGWMNRLIAALPETAKIPHHDAALAVGALTPLTLRGPSSALGWAPPQLKPVDGDLSGRLMDLYSQSDPMLAKSLREGIETGKIAGGMTLKKAQGGPSDPDVMLQMAQGAARLMARDDGPRLCAMAFEGWDTHATEAQRLNRLLGGLDQAIAALETGLGEHWQTTIVMVTTEFGRTAQINGTSGTDHGTGAAAFLAGGTLKGGRVITDWPGLKTTQLYEGRDLAPTTDIRSVTKGVIKDLYGISDTVLARDIFPDSPDTLPMKGLIG